MPSRQVDLNLLTPLRALLEERSVTRAAERLQMSQPAMSAALKRLRRHFDDELLSRRGNAYHLTPLAEQLLERVHPVLAGVDRVFSAQGEFDAAAMTREFRVHSSDFGISVLGGALTSVLAEHAPRASLRFEPVSQPVVVGAPETLRYADGLLMPHGFITQAEHQDLFEDRWVLLVDAESPVRDPLTLDDLGRLPWAYTLSGPSEYTPAAKQLQLLGVEPRVEVVSPSFLAVPSLLRGSNRVALLQETVAARFAASGEFRVLECPFDVVPLVEGFWWHPVHDREPEHAWFRSMLSQAVERAGLSMAEGARCHP